ncbi:arginine--tRNA ligase [Candidatus Gromoviella agglomerans]|uniref:arginine--tRNA ligase n=1 Tax=Candidatus Gromoviella agglomerans TaxID=2806609 RepID=UPI001E403BAF|nr:arginine--tRNA ligase [Candidatus Gromoviella agglomerans]UFX98329.1 Arginine--tRNA ligase [Candidatus Gromoviella agglomerans]
MLDLLASDIVTHILNFINSDLDISAIRIFPSQYGDLSTNLPKLLSQKHHESIVKAALSHECVESALILNEFLNINFKLSIFKTELVKCIKNKSDYCYGKFLNMFDLNKKVNVEYVSANPTGRLHLGHARSAIFGDAVANLMQKIGFDVVREYYINDGGGQVDALAESVFARYKSLCGIEVDCSNIAYPDESLFLIAQKLVDQYKTYLLDANDVIDVIKPFCVAEMIEWIKGDLSKLHIKHDVFFSEKSLIYSREMDDMYDLMQKNQLIVEDYIDQKLSNKGVASGEKLLMFKSSNEDLSLRPLKKSKGEWTYFATDIAYHLNKINRGFDLLINIWGADHDNHVKVIKDVVNVLNNKAKLEILIVQMVNLLEDGVSVKMSKRSGNFVSVQEVVDKIGINVLRFMMLMKKPDTHFDFDMKSALSASLDNPVFYVNYAYVRANSVIRQYEKLQGISLQDSLDDMIKNMNFYSNLISEELNIVKMIRECPIMFVSAAYDRAPHRIINFLIAFAKVFHIMWNKGKEDFGARLMIKGDEFVTQRRVLICFGVSVVIDSCLNALGIFPDKEMRD